MNVDDLVAGPELDALVAEKVMGQRVIRSKRKPKRVKKLPAYSTDFSQAMKVVEHLSRRGYSMEFVGPPELGGKKEFGCKFVPSKGRRDEFDVYKIKDAPFAISIAALKAVGA